jgi:chromosome segregation ATPase
MFISQGRRKQLEALDEMLREKSVKTEASIEEMDERMRALLTEDEKLQQREKELDEWQAELDESHTNLKTRIETYNGLMAEALETEKHNKDVLHESAALREELKQREAHCRKWEARLNQMQEQLADVEERDREGN